MGWMVFRLILSLAFVVAVMWMAARVARKRGLGGAGHGLVQIVARQSLTRGSSVNVIKVADQVFVVGATDTQVTLLSEVDPILVQAHLDAQEQAKATKQAATGGTGMPNIAVGTGALAGSVFDPKQWSAFVQGLRDRTVRRS